MENKCPDCGKTLLTKTIRKKIGSGIIDYPIAATCPKCKWSKDLTGAGDIDAKPVMADEVSSIKEGAKTEIIILAILVLGAIAYVFLIK